MKIVFQALHPGRRIDPATAEAAEPVAAAAVPGLGGPRQQPDLDLPRGLSRDRPIDDLQQPHDLTANLDQPTLHGRRLSTRIHLPTPFSRSTTNADRRSPL
jgi:hypothetical protein